MGTVHASAQPEHTAERLWSSRQTYTAACSNRKAHEERPLVLHSVCFAIAKLTRAGFQAMLEACGLLEHLPCTGISLGCRPRFLFAVAR